MRKIKTASVLLASTLVASSISISGCSTYRDNMKPSETIESEARLETEPAETLTPASSAEITERTEDATDGESNSPVTEENQSLSEIITSNSYEQASKVLETDKNSNYSAFSLYYSLAMLEMGADGETKEALDKFLGTDITKDVDNLSAIMTEFNKEDSPFSIANAEFVSDKIDLKEEYANLIKDKLNAEVTGINFEDEAKANEIINSWISSKTNGMIKEGMGVTKDDLMDIINAVYFKDSWNLFREEDTEKSDFNLADGTKVQVDMMRSDLNENVSYLEGEGYKTLRIPMSNSTFVVVLPDGTVDDLVSRLDEVFTKGNRPESSYKVNIKLPRFKFDTSKSLDDLLQNNGLDIIYSNSADLSKIGDAKTGEGLLVNTVNQKTAIEVNEQGVEASAVTEIGIRSMSAQVEEEPEILDFIVDKPVLFSITSKSGVPVFVGVLADPSK